MSYVIKEIEAGSSIYCVLLDGQGYPRAQGSKDLCEKTMARLMEIEQANPASIWLQPMCANCAPDSDGRQWCDEDVWGPCGTCGKAAVRYDLSRSQKGSIDYSE